MPTINGRACVVNGTPVDKVFSNGKQVYGRNLLAGMSKANAVHQASSWFQWVSNINTKFIKVGQPLCLSVFINNAPYAKVLGTGNSHCIIQAKSSLGKILLEGTGNAINFDADGISQTSIIVPDETTSIQIFILTSRMGQNTYYGYLKVEFGTIATPWTPAPEDIM